MVKAIATISVVLIVAAQPADAQGYLQQYRLEGVVRDSTSGQPVEGAQVWLHGSQTGDITGSSGRLRIDVRLWPASIRTYVRVCGREAATNKLLDFRADTLSQTADTLVSAEFLVGRTEEDCSPPPRLPWKVKPSEASEFAGHLVLARGGSFIESCSGESYDPAWPPDVRASEFWSDQSEMGDRKFIRIAGRLAPFSRDVIPFQTVLVRKVLQLQPPEKNDCPSELEY